MSTPPESMTPYAWGEAQTARTYALVGFVFFAIVAAIWALVTLVASLAIAFFDDAWAPWPFPLLFPFGVFLALGAGLTVWSWLTLKDIEAGRYQPAQTASLVLGIFGLFVNLISGIFFLLAYSKIGSAITYAQAPPPAYAAAPAAPAAPAGRICVECGRPVAMDAKYCPHCGKELA